MNTNIFLSNTNVAPYQILTSLNPEDTTMDINFSEDPATKSSSGSIYMIVKSGNSFDNVEVIVENELQSGASLFITKVDEGGSPIGWKKRLIFENLGSYESTQDTIIMLKYKWEVINNEFVLKLHSPNAFVNIYSF